MAKKENLENLEFVNPWVAGINYEMFLNAIPSGVTVKEYLKGKLGVANESDLIEWLENDLKHYEENKKNK